MPNLQKPGETPEGPGLYIERDRSGGEVPDARQVTIEPGDEKLPPTQEQDRAWERIGPPKP